MNNLSLNTKAILLLTAPLQVGKNNPSVKLLTPSEYRKLARYLFQIKHQPEDFLLSGNDALLDACNKVINRERLSTLLDRGFLLSQALEYWSARAIWVMSRADADYPKIYKQRLGEYTPAVLYGCGNKQLISSGGLAVVGSRNTTSELLEQTAQVGALAAHSGVTLVSGGAKGVDQASMTGSLEAGGRVCGVLANNLEQAALSRNNNQWLRNKQLVLFSAYDPKSRFTVWQAMERNKYIYALAQAALVMNSDKDKGGTWEGAKEQLEKYHFVPIYVRSTGKKSIGLEAIQAMGAKLWPNPTNKEELKKTFHFEKPQKSNFGTNLSLLDDVEIQQSNTNKAQVEIVTKKQIKLPKKVGSAELKSKYSPKEELFNAATLAIKVVLKKEPQNLETITEKLGVNKSQMSVWLKQLIEENVVQKLTRPVRYQLIE